MSRREVRVLTRQTSNLASGGNGGCGEAEGSWLKEVVKVGGQEDERSRDFKISMKDRRREAEHGALPDRSTGPREGSQGRLKQREALCTTGMGCRRGAPRPKAGPGEGGIGQVDGDRGHERACQQVGSPVVRSQLRCRTDQTCLDVGETEIKGSKATQDFWLQLPFTKMPFTRQGSVCQWGRGVPLWGV